MAIETPDFNIKQNKDQMQPYEELDNVIKSLEKNDIVLKLAKEERARLLEDLKSYGDVNADKVQETLKKYSVDEAK